jgi:NTE family protein
MLEPARSSGRRDRIALVLAGGGARGAYEAGALAALAPALAARGEAPDIIVGTSIGALNGAFIAARAQEPLDHIAATAVEMWRELRWGDALRPLASPSELGRLLGAAATLARLPGADLHGLLDPSPLNSTLERLVDFKQIARNVQDGTLTAAAVVATAYTTTRSVVFHHGGPELGLDLARAIDYFATPLAPEHVLASAAIPGAFPAIEVRRPREAKGWYGDGGVRLNAPLKPALELGADRVIVIGLNSSLTNGERPARPDAIDGAAQLLQVVLGDQIADDVATLATVNETLVPTGSSAGRARARHGGRRTIPYIFIAPSDRLAIGRLARDVYKRHYAGIGGLLRNTNLALLGRIVGAERSAVHAELLSYLFLAQQFVEELIELGRHDGERWVERRHDAGLWQVGRLPAVKTGSARGRRRSARPRVTRATRAARV